MSDAYVESRKFRLGEFVLDVDRATLHCGSEEISLRPRSFDVLRYLVEHPGKLVSRDELMDALWQGAVVTEDSVTQCLIDVRRALGDSNQEMIRTVPRRGYRLDLPVEALAPDAPSTPAADLNPVRSGPKALAALLVIAAAAGLVAMLLMRQPSGADQPRAPAKAVAATPSIAILPFAHMGPDSNQSFFADGVSEEIINSLARQKGLKVIARTSSFSFRDSGYDVGTIASRLDVSHVLEGSVRNDGDALRINVQLVDAGSGEYVWNEQFDRELSAASVFTIQSEIATAVAESLQNELTPQERARLVRIPTENLEALTAYFKARQAMETRGAGELRRAEQLLRKAISLDDGFALAYVSLAENLRLQSNYGDMPRRVADDEGMAAIRKALALDEELGQAYASLGNILARNADIRGAEAAFLRGIELSPSYAPLFQWYGQFLHVFAARSDEAPTYSRIAVALDPRSAIINADYARALKAAGQYDDALAQLDRVIEMAPQFSRAYFDKGQLLIDASGNFAAAVPLFEQAQTIEPSSFISPNQISQAYLDLGDFDRAAQFLADAERVAPGQPWIGETRLMLHAITGNSIEARRSAGAVLQDEPWHVRPLRYLRDEALAAGDIASATAHYMTVFGSVFGDDPSVIGPANFAAAIDASYLLMLSGRRERAELILSQCRKLMEGRPRHGWYMNPVGDVKMQAILGNEDRALELLQAAVDEGWRKAWRFELLHDRALARLAERPEFKAIVDTLEADMAAQRQRLEDTQADLQVH